MIDKKIVKYTIFVFINYKIQKVDLTIISYMTLLLNLHLYSFVRITCMRHEK